MKSLCDAMLDPDLFGRTFGSPTFAAWRTVAKVLDGLPRAPDATGSRAPLFARKRTAAGVHPHA